MFIKIRFSLMAAIFLLTFVANCVLTFPLAYGSVEIRDGDEDEGDSPQEFVMPPVEAFIAKWSRSAGSEIGSSQSFIIELCNILGVPRPASPRSHIADNSYTFEAQVTFTKADGRESTGRIDLYKKGYFLWESKQGSPKITKAERESLNGWRVGTAVRDTPSWDNAMWKAREQAFDYAKSIPPQDGRPPFVLISDIGHEIEIHADFTGKGFYLPFPSARANRIRLADLRREEVQHLLKSIWTDPYSLDPSREREKVTRDIAIQLGELAKSLESSGHNPEEVAKFLMGCVFVLFAEDCNLLPHNAFTQLLATMEDRPDDFVQAVSSLWADMSSGGHSKVLNQPVLKFGGSYEQVKPLRLTKEQLGLLRQAGEANWASVEPAVFGTFLERALDPKDRHSLGAHYTPPAYVEKLVVPTIIEPLREEWSEVISLALSHVGRGDQAAAIEVVEAFHKRLSEINVLDPSCGSGNFLATALMMMKDLEAEVIQALRDLGLSDLEITAKGHSVRPWQFKGIEVSPHAAGISELVLWISYFQKHNQQYGNVAPPQPILETYGRGGIECRDAILAWDLTDTDNDDLRYLNARKADPWPEADFIVGNPPFIGNHRMREALGDTYVEALRRVYPEVPGKVDYVLYWWHRAAELVRQGKVMRFGFIATKTIAQKEGRKVIDFHMKSEPPLVLAFAIPNHPWSGNSEDSVDKAQVRISMTVGTIENVPGTLAEVILERPGKEGDGFKLVNYDSRTGKINSKEPLNK